MDPEFTNDMSEARRVFDLAVDEIEQYYAMVAAHQVQILADFRAKFGDTALLAMIRAFHPGYQTKVTLVSRGAQ